MFNQKYLGNILYRDDIQERVNNIYGNDEWTVKEYNGGHEPFVIVHKCGQEKKLSRASSFFSKKHRCLKCEKATRGKDKSIRKERDKSTHVKSYAILDIDKLNKEMSELTYGTYEILEILDHKNREILVNHKNCERPPYKTTTYRFFNYGQRCASCSKKMTVGRKNKLESSMEIDRLSKYA